MTGKRQATYDLNHDNWDREEEPEERGSFRTAPEDELKNRVIKKAKRKIVPGNDGGVDTHSVFSGFSGFGSTADAAVTSPFSFLSKIPAVSGSTNGVVSSSTTISATPSFSFGSSSNSAPTGNSAEISKTFTTGDSAVPAPSVKTSHASDESSMFSEYKMKLSSLNQAVCDWIKTHVEENAVCILSPIFKDYERYLEQIENEKNAKVLQTTDESEKPVSASEREKFSSSSTDVTTKNTETLPFSEKPTEKNAFSFDIKKSEDAASVKKCTAQGFSFGLVSPSSSSMTAAKSSFSFGNTSNSANQQNTAKTFAFNHAGGPFSFNNVKPPNASDTNISEGDADVDEEPPKNEFKLVVEDDAVYSKKCKVFVKKDGNFVDRGVGTLYMKPIESSDKTQLLVRADTNLGNILVNVILNSAIPTQRMGKNNVMMVCLPTADVDKPTPILLRVKTSDEADELLEKIDKYKK